MIHSIQERFVGKDWFSNLEKHLQGEIEKLRAKGVYTPSGSSAEVARKYAMEAFPKYAGSRAETWMLVRANLANLAANIKDPSLLKEAVKAQKDFYENAIQFKGRPFGYVNEFPSPWTGNFLLPEGPMRAKMDEATGISGRFDKAFPEFAKVLEERVP